MAVYWLLKNTVSHRLLDEVGVNQLEGGARPSFTVEATSHQHCAEVRAHRWCTALRVTL